MNPSESLWLKQALQGDDDAFAALVEAYQRPVYNLCYRMLGNSEQEAEDAAQETFWRAYQALRRYDPQRSFVTWLLSIAAHYCIDQQRRRRIPLTSIDDLLEETLPCPASNPEALTGQAQEAEALRTLLQDLSPTDRAAVILRYWYDFSEEEIARTLSLSVSAVKSRLHRARLTLAQRWQATHSQTPLVGRRQHESPAF